jgi:hypothetical protein
MLNVRKGEQIFTKDDKENYIQAFINQKDETFKII